MSPTMLATAARVLYRLLERNGLDPDAVFLDCGLDPLKLRDPRVKRACLAPSREPAALTQEGEYACVTLDEVRGYQVVVFARGR